MEAAPHPWPALGVLLLRDGLVDKDELEEILSDQRDSRQQRVSGRRLGEILIQRGKVTPTQVAKLVAEQFEIPFIDVDEADIDVRVATIMSEDDARRLSAIPIGRNGDGSFLVAIADPATVLFSDELRRLLDSVPRFAVVGPDAIERAITFVYSRPVPTFTVAPEPSESADDLIVMPSSDAAHASSEQPAPEPAPTTSTHPWPALGALLLRDGLITDDELEAALAQQRVAPSLRLGEILTGKGLVTRGAISRLVAEQYELPFYELHRVDIDPEVVRRLPEELAWQLKAIPIAALEDGSLQIAIADPTSAVYTDDLQRALAVPLTFVVASPDDVETALDAVYDPTFESPVDEGAGQEAESEPVHVDPSAVGSLHLAEPPHLDVESGTSEAAEVPEVEDESPWTTPLELVEDTPSTDLPEHAEPDVTEPYWAPVAEIVFPPEVEQELEQELEPDTPVADAEALELLPADEQEPEDAEVYEFSWPGEPDETRDEPTLAEDLAVQIAGAMLADVVEVTEDDRDDALAEVTSHDIFGIASRPSAEGTSESVTVQEEELAVPAPAPLRYLPQAREPDEEELAPATETEPRFVVVEPELTEPTKLTEPTEVTELEPSLEPTETTPLASDVAAAVEGALAAGASTLHFSPRDDELLVRARVDGFVRELGTTTSADRDALVARLESEGIVRTHVVTTSRGPKTTLVVRERPGAPTVLAELGLGSDATTTLLAALEQPSGAILVCGPAGSGVTTTLYALLAAAATPERVVATVEHPIERPLEDVDQIEADATSGITFGAALRELRLTDTDVVLVGGLPDRDAVVGALSAAYEGRLVLAGFHAPSAPAAVLRLADTGMTPSLLASSLGCVVAQRLVRTVCADCRETYYASEDELQALGQDVTGSPRLLARGTGCESCGGTGFRGRTALFEVMPVTDELRDLVADGASAKKLRKAAVGSGMRTLRDEGIRLTLEGVTSAAEVARVLGDDL